MLCTVEGREAAHHQIPELAAGESRTIEVPVDTALRPGSYTLRLRVETPLKEASDPYVSEESVTFTLMPRRPPRMPVVIWGLYGAGNVMRELPRLTEIGFTLSGVSARISSASLTRGSRLGPDLLGARGGQAVLKPRWHVMSASSRRFHPATGRLSRSRSSGV